MARKNSENPTLANLGDRGARARLAKVGTRPKNPPLPALEVRTGKCGVRSITYQLRHVLCGKDGCLRLHGPYWYAYWKADHRLRTAYVGRTFQRLRLDRNGSPVARKPKGDSEE